MFSRRLQNISIRTRLLGGMLTIGVLLLIPMLAGFWTLERMSDQTAQMRDREFAASVLLARVRSNLDVLRRAESGVVAERTESSLTFARSEAEKLFAMGSLLDSYGLGPMADSLRGAVSDVERLLPEVYSIASTGGSAVAKSVADARIGSAINRAERALGGAERSLRESTDNRVAQVALAIQRAEWTLFVILLAAAVITLVVAVRLTGFVDRPLKALESGMGAVADGKFDHPLAIPPGRSDEFGRLAAAFRTMAHRLRELEQMRASWLAVATHELKNEVGPIIGYMDLLTDEVLGPLAQKQMEKCRRTKILAERLKTHLLQYLAASRLESESGKISPHRFSLGEFLDEIDSDFRVMATPRGIQFRVSRESALPDYVVWDRELIREVLENLLSNAFKFTREQGTVEVIAEADAEAVYLMVRDTGAGIPSEDVEHIFQKYYKARNQAHSEEKGTGLGLAIARQIVESHGGSISCKSIVGSGTTFTITMPVVAVGGVPEANQPATPTAPPTAISGETRMAS